MGDTARPPSRFRKLCTVLHMLLVIVMVGYTMFAMGMGLLELSTWQLP